MNREDIEENTMVLSFKCEEDGELMLSAGYHFSEDMPDDIRGGYMTLMHGIMAMLDVEPEAFLKASLYAEFGAEVERQVTETEQEERRSSRPNLAVVDFKGKMQ